MGVRSEQRKVQEVVRAVMICDFETRNNNDRLVMAVYQQYAFEMGINLDDKSFHSVMLHRKEWRFPSYESITRARRKLQEQDESLRSDDNIQAMRELREEEYREWAVTG